MLFRSFYVILLIQIDHIINSCKRITFEISSKLNFLECLQVTMFRIDFLIFLYITQERYHNTKHYTKCIFFFKSQYYFLLKTIYVLLTIIPSWYPLQLCTTIQSISITNNNNNDATLNAQNKRSP